MACVWFTNKFSLYVLVLLLLTITNSIEDIFFCNSPLGEISLKLHRSRDDQSGWFKDVVFPLEIDQGSLQQLQAILKPDFDQLCKSEAYNLVSGWSVADCTEDILMQIEGLISQKCSLNNKVVDPVASGMKTSSVDDQQQWTMFENEIKELAKTVLVEGSGDGEVFVNVVNSTSRCAAMRKFTKMTTGQAAPILAALQPLDDGSLSPSYSSAVSLLEGSLGVGAGVSGWRDLAYFALVNIEHTVGAGRWDPRGYPEAFERHNIFMQRHFGMAGRLRENADGRSLKWLLKVFPQPYLFSKHSHEQVGHSSLVEITTGGETQAIDKHACTSHDKVIVITAVSEDSGHKLDALRASARHAHVKLVVLTAPTTAVKWQNDWKPRLLLQYLREFVLHSPKSTILFVDGYDVLLSPLVRDLPCQLSPGVTFAAERDCWPDAAACRWLTSVPFLNSGVFAGTGSDVLSMLEEIRESFGEFAYCGDDQRTYQRYAWEHPHLVTVDKSSTFFQCMHGYSWEVEVGEDASVVLFESREGVRVGPPKLPMVMHFNSFDGKKMMDQLVSALGYKDDGIQ